MTTFNNGKPTALITGASGGIGLELARIFGRERHNLVLVARSEGRLNELANELHHQYGAATKVVAKDLNEAAAPDELFADLQQAGITVDVLVNNAGFANYGRFDEISLEKDLSLLQLNIVALTHLTKLFIEPMVARKSGKIMNVASTASFQPGPLMTTYYASKAYVLFFSEGLAAEYKDLGITVTALCPGPTKTGFQSRANMEVSRLVQGGLMPVEAVAEAGFKGLMAGKTVVIPGLFNKVGSLLPRFVPRDMAARLVMNMQAATEH